MSHRQPACPPRCVPALRAAALAALLCFTAQAAGEKILVVGAEGTIPPMDPHRMTGTVGLRIVDAIFDTLVREDLTVATKSAPELAPGLAESWAVSDDGKTYTFAIRDGVRFHDGTALDATVVKANFDRFMDKSSPFYDDRAAGRLNFLTILMESTSAPDPRTFVVELKAPFSALLRLLTDRRASIVSRAALDAYPGDELGNHPVGTGPFTLAAFEQGAPLELQRNDAYWGGKPKLDGIIFQPILDATAMAIAMQAGELHFIPSASSEQVAQLEGKPGIVVQYPDTANERFIRFNTRVAPTNNRAFRQALNYAVDRAQIQTLFSGDAVPVYGPVPRGNEISGEGVAERYAFDQDEARRLIAESGVQTPVTLKLMAPNSGPGNALVPQMMSLLDQQLAAVGVEIDVQFLEFRTLIATERGGYADDVHGSQNGWTTGADSAFWLERMFSGLQQPPKGVNRGWYRNDAVDALFEQGREETDAEKRVALYREAADLIAEDAPWVFLYQDRLPRIVLERVSGIVEASSVYVDYSKIDLR